VEECRRLLAAARATLVEKCAGPLTQVVRSAETPPDGLVEDITGALEQLDRAHVALGGVGDAVDATVVWKLMDRLEMLRSFGRMFLALSEFDSSEESRKRLVEACGGLAIFVDDANEAVSESANFWRGVAYRRAGRSDRALQVLRPIISAPASRRIGFLTRIERCRALEDTGNYVAGVALCLRLQARVDAWFADEDEATRMQAAHTLLSVQAGLLRGWAAQLAKAGDSDEAARVEAEAAALEDSASATGGSRRWLELDRSIGGLDGWETLQASPTTRPSA
jgi:hypothetical protein